MRPHVSVIVAAYNAARFLPETVESVLAQTLPDWELVLVDDGSTDGTPQIMDSFAAKDGRIRVVRQANAGASTARNMGFLHSDPETPYVLFLDSDDLLERDALSVLVQAVENDPNLVGAHAAARIIDQDGDFVADGDLMSYLRDRRRIEGGRLRACPLDAPTSFESVAHSNYVITPGTALLRRRAVQFTDLFDTRLLNAEDWDFVIRLTLSGDLACVYRHVLRYRRHPSNKSRKHWRMVRTYYAIGRKYGHNTLLSPDQKKNFRAGAGYDGVVKFSFASGCLLRLRLQDCMSQVFRGVRALARYAGTIDPRPLAAQDGPVLAVVARRVDHEERLRAVK